MEALQCLQDFLSDRRARGNWSADHENAMKKYISLCVELRDSRRVKEGLYHYKTLAVANNPKSLEAVTKQLIDMALRRAEEARSECAASSLENIEDLEEEESPEVLLMTTVSAADSKERKEREVLVPWLRFAWETFRSVLNTLKNTPKLEKEYHSVAARAFAFLRDNNRRTECRKLCDLLRDHLKEQLARDMTQKSLEDMTQKSLEVRFEQLDACAQLEMWSEGFRTVEDIRRITSITGQQPGAVLMAAYYEGLARIFWVSGDFLFHAYACFRHYKLSVTQNRKLSAEEKQSLATRTVIAALCAHVYDPKAEDETTYYRFERRQDRKARLAALLNFVSPPSREALLAELRTQGVLREVPDRVRELAAHLEQGFAPLRFVGQVAPELEWLAGEEGLSQYVPPLKELVVLRLLRQLSRVYTSIRLARFHTLVEPVGLSPQQLEKMIVRAVRHRYLRVRIDHREEGCLHFEDDAMEAETMRQQLSELARRLQRVAPLVAGGRAAAEEPARHDIFREARRALRHGQRHAYERIELIERQKQEAELKREREQREARRLEEERKDRERRELMLEHERQRAEQERKRQEEEARKREAEEKARKAREAGVEAGNVEAMTREEREDLDRKIAEAEAKRLAEEQRKMEERAKRLDFLVRALREAEYSKVRRMEEATLRSNEEHHRKQNEALLRRDRQAWERQRELKDRLQKVLNKQGPIRSYFMGRRWERFEEQRGELEARRAEYLRGKVERARERKAKKEQEEATRAAQDQMQAAEEMWERRDEEAFKRQEQERRRQLEAAHTTPPLAAPGGGSSWRATAAPPARQPAVPPRAPVEEAPEEDGGGGWRMSRPGARAPRMEDPAAEGDAFAALRRGGGEARPAFRPRFARRGGGAMGGGGREAAADGGGGGGGGGGGETGVR